MRLSTGKSFRQSPPLSISNHLVMFYVCVVSFSQTRLLLLLGYHSPIIQTLDTTFIQWNGRKSWKWCLISDVSLQAVVCVLTGGMWVGGGGRVACLVERFKIPAKTCMQHANMHILFSIQFNSIQFKCFDISHLQQSRIVEVKTKGSQTNKISHSLFRWEMYIKKNHIHKCIDYISSTQKVKVLGLCLKAQCGGKAEQMTSSSERGCSSRCAEPSSRSPEEHGTNWEWIPAAVGVPLRSRMGMCVRRLLIPGRGRGGGANTLLFLF